MDDPLGTINGPVEIVPVTSCTVQCLRIQKEDIR